MRTYNEIFNFISSKSPEWIAERSFKNCHAKGIWSFVFNEDPLIRMFYVEPGVKLKVTPDNISIGFHQHRNEIRLISFLGSVFHHKTELFDKSSIDDSISTQPEKIRKLFLNDYFRLKEYEYQSSIITKSEPKLIQTDKEYYALDSIKSLDFHGITYDDLREQYHSVSLPEDHQGTAWFVIEGRSIDSAYKGGYFYSNHEKYVIKRTLDSLYKKVSPEEVKEIFEIIAIKLSRCQWQSPRSWIDFYSRYSIVKSNDEVKDNKEIIEEEFKEVIQEKEEVITDKEVDKLMSVELKEQLGNEGGAFRYNLHYVNLNDLRT